MLLKEIRKNIIFGIEQALKLSYAKGELPDEAVNHPVNLLVPPEEDLGDLSCSLPMQLARIAKKSPLVIANIIVKNFSKENTGYIKYIKIAGSGYINFYLSPLWHRDILETVNKEKENYGKSTVGHGIKIQVEFVSANPTGPLHIGHGRGAAIGDSLSNILKACGFDVTREYYINDVGNQMKNLGASTQSHYYEMLGSPIPFPENTYKGIYIKEIAQSVKDKYGNKYLTSDPKESLLFFSQYTGDFILDGIKKDLEDFGVKFDIWFRESTLHDDGTAKKMLEYLKEKEFIYEKDGALWLKTIPFGDDKDRVVISREGKTTYLASDIAYHYNKFNRGFSKIIDIWGADHHGYVARIKATAEALGYKKDDVIIILYQLVNLLRDGKQVAMSTRTGEFVTLKEVVDEVGKNVARFYFIMRTSGSHLDFDLELAKKQSMENPVYYIQYAYARISSIFNEAAKNGIDINKLIDADLSLLTNMEELQIIKKIAYFPDIVEESARTYEPHRIVNFLQELAGMFHPYYNKYRIIGDEIKITQSRLFFLKCLSVVIKNALSLLGIDAPERM